MNLIPLNFITKGEQTPLRRMMLERALAGGGALSEYEITGNPVAFNTNVQKPLSGLTIPFLPVQAGSGDPSPQNQRPISGWSGVTAWRTGKNLLKVAQEMLLYVNGGENMTYSFSDGSMSVTVNTYGSNFFLFKVLEITPSMVGTQFIYSGKGSRTSFVSCNQNGGDRVELTNGIITSESVGKLLGIRIYLQNTGTYILDDAQVEVGSTASPYAEYTGQSYPVTFPALGKNLFNKNTVIGVYNKGIDYGGKIVDSQTSGYTESFTPVKQNKTYTLTGSGTRVVAFYNAEMNFINRLTGKDPPQAFTTPDGAAFIRIQYLLATVDFSDWQLEEGSTATAYEPFDNTVYGGTLDAVNGVLTVAIAFAEFDGNDDESWNVGAIDANKSRAFIALPGAPKSGYNRDIIGNYIKPTASAQSSPDLWTANINASGNILIGIDQSITTVEAWKAYLAEHSLQIAYPLATPYEIPLSDIPVPVTLIGDNTIWTDTNGENTVKYLKKG